jgi:hypothetical protein
VRWVAGWLEDGGEFSAATELRRHFPGILDNAQARGHARQIAAWPQPGPPHTKNGKPRPDRSA